MNGTRARGFTLIEVLVALAIFAVMAAAIAKQSGGFSEQVFRLERMTMAHWVAENHVDALRSERAWPSPGREESESELGGRQWRIEQQVGATARDGMRRVEVQIFEEGDEDRVLASLTAFLGEH